MSPLETAPSVERVVEGTEYFVEVQIHPKDLLPRLLTALGSNADLLAYAAGYRATNDAAVRQACLSKIAAAYPVEQACVLRLHGATAEDLATALDELCGEPERCHAVDCPNYCIDKSQWCPTHDEVQP